MMPSPLTLTAMVKTSWYSNLSRESLLRNGGCVKYGTFVHYLVVWIAWRYHYTMGDWVGVLSRVLGSNDTDDMT